MNELEVYQKARELVKKGWTQHYFAKDAKGNAAEPDSPDAVCYCSAGAILAVTGGTYSANENFMPFLEANKIFHIIGWNDNPYRTQEEVVAAFDKVIESLK